MKHPNGIQRIIDSANDRSHPETNAHEKILIVSGHLRLPILTFRLQTVNELSSLCR